MKAIIQTVTSNIEKSLHFYEQLDFNLSHINGLYYASDDKASILINPTRTARAGLILYSEDWQSIVDTLQQWIKVVSLEDGFLFADPSGTWIQLVNKASLETIPPLNDYPSKLGNFSGLSLEMIDIELSLKIWETLGFKQTMGNVDQGWVALQNDQKFGIGLMKQGMCPHLFFNPSLSFFNGKNNLKIIKELRKMNIQFTEEITQFNPKGIVDNVIVRDPGGLGFFLFSDG